MPQRPRKLKVHNICENEISVSQELLDTVGLDIGYNVALKFLLVLKFGTRRQSLCDGSFVHETRNVVSNIFHVTPIIILIMERKIMYELVFIFNATTTTAHAILTKCTAVSSASRMHETK